MRVGRQRRELLAQLQQAVACPDRGGVLGEAGDFLGTHLGARGEDHVVVGDAASVLEQQPPAGRVHAGHAAPLERDVAPLERLAQIEPHRVGVRRAVAELVRVTRPGGRIVLAELNRYSLWAAWRCIKGRRGCETWAHAHFYARRELAALLRRAGGHDVQTAAAAYLPPRAPAWLRSRAASCERRARRLGSVGAAFSLVRGQVGAG